MQPGMRIAVIMGFVTYLAIMLLIGVWSSKKNNEAKATTGKSWLSEYLVAGRGMGWLVIGMAMVTTIYSAGTFIGAPALGYTNGYIWSFTIGFQNLAGVLPLGIVGIRYAILGRKLNFVSYLDFYQSRFNSKLVTLIAGIFIVVLLIPLMTAQFAAGAHVIEAFSGIPYKIGIVIMLLVTAFYTIAGGYRAVTLTDVVQGIIMTAGAIAMWGILFKTPGGPTAVNQTLLQSNPGMLTMNNVGIAVRGIWVFAIWAIVAPQTVWKCTTYKRSSDMYRAMILAAIIIPIFSTTFQLWGVLGRGLLPNLASADKVIPSLILGFLPPIVAGFLIVSPIAALMSTVDSVLLISSATITKDLYALMGGKEMNVKQQRNFTYGVALIIALFVLWSAISPPKFLELFVMYALGGIGAVFWWPFLLGLYWKGATKWGAIVSMLFAFPFYILNDRFFHLFALHSAITTWILSGIIMIVVSLITPKTPFEIIKKCWEPYTTKTEVKI
jgi:sodium/pantothenate symporter